jgi:prephenate dehydrogenase
MSHQVIRILVVGCGLMGTSLALRWKESTTLHVRLTGVEPRQDHRQAALSCGAFEEAYASVEALFETEGNSQKFDYAVLALPVTAACEVLESVQRISTWMMDICSVKTSVCQTASRLGLSQTFLPAHPMAGLAQEGPFAAHSKLYEGTRFLYIESWPALHAWTPLLEETGAELFSMPSAEAHDRAMSVVSHSIHVTSLSLMNMYGSVVKETEHSYRGTGQAKLHRVTGPAFRDLTRLAASPIEFWADTLLENASHTSDVLCAINGQIERFQVALSNRDREALVELLKEAKNARQDWEGEH